MGRKEAKLALRSLALVHSLFPAQQPGGGDSQMLGEMTSTSTSNPAVMTHVSPHLLPALCQLAHLPLTLAPVPSLQPYGFPSSSGSARHASAQIL